jgi:hypothetical protein
VGWRGFVAAAAEAFEPAGSVVVRRGKVLGQILVPCAGAEEEGDAIVGAGDDERGVTGVEALDDISAEGVADEESVVFVGGLGVDDFLESLPAVRGMVVEALGNELEVKHAGGAGGGLADFTEGDFAGDDLEKARAHESAGLVAFGRPADGLGEELTVMGIFVGVTVVAELENQDIPGFCLVAREPRTGGGMFDHPDTDVGDGLEELVEMVGLEVVSADDEENADRFGGVVDGEGGERGEQ